MQGAKALLEKSLPGQVADDFAAQRGGGDWKRRRQRQVGVVGLLHEAVVLQMVGPIHPQLVTTQPARHGVINAAARVQQTMRRLMHQDEQAELPVADDHHNQGNRQRPDDTHAHRHADHCPAVRHQQQAAPARFSRKRRPFNGAEEGFRSNAGSSSAAASFRGL